MLNSVNYNHLRYFWTVARVGSVSAAARVLNLTQPTVSSQLRQFERTIGAALFGGEGRDRQLTEAGHLMFRFAEEVFSLEREVHDAFSGLPTGRSRSLRVGVTDGIPKLLVHRFLLPALQLSQSPQLVVREGSTESLLALLDDRALDVVLLDAPAAGRMTGRAHALGASDVALFASPELARDHRRDFPASLHGAPMLMPPQGTVLRQALDAWLAVEGLQPRIVAEVDDSALLKELGRTGLGLLALPAAIAAEARSRYSLRQVGVVEGARVMYYAVALGRKIENETSQLIDAMMQQQLEL
jgi:LysR family transcriptional regulator, transcriptional activator of nhaA